MRRLVVAAAILVPLVLTTALAALEVQPLGRAAGAPGQAAPVIGTAVVYGKVVDAGDGSPVSDAFVTLQVQGNNTPGRVATDGQGRFLFREVPKGPASLSVSASGYLSGGTGTVRPGPMSLVVSDGARLEQTVRIFKYAVISGSVTDEAGEPVAGDSIRVFPMIFVAGRKRLSAPLIAMTDDRGVFRFSGLTPGDYVLAHVAQTITMPAAILADAEAARAKGPDANQAFSDALAGSGANMLTGPGNVVGDFRLLYGTNARAPEPTADGQVFVYPTLFYPGSTSVSGATTLTLRSGEEREGLGFQLRPSRSVRVSGTVVSPAGPVGNLGLRLISSEIDQFATETTIDPYATITMPNGEFTFLGVSPGTYTLKAVRVPRTGLGPVPGPPRGFMMALEDPTVPSLWGTLPLTVGDVDVSNVTLTLRTGARVSGRVEFNGSATKPTPQQLTQLLAMSVEPMSTLAGGSPSAINAFQAWRGRLDENGNFLTAELPPGHYIVRPLNNPAGWTLESATVQGHDVLDAPLDLGSADVTGVVVRFTDRPAKLTGTVRDVPAGPAVVDVLVFPQDPKGWTDYGSLARRLRLTSVGNAGNFSLVAIPDGDYFVAAVRDIEVASWPDPTLLAALARVATRITIAPGEAKTADLAVSVIK